MMMFTILQLPPSTIASICAADQHDQRAVICHLFCPRRLVILLAGRVLLAVLAEEAELVVGSLQVA